MTAALVREGVRQARASLAAHSKSFALAGRLLPRACRDDAAVVYAWCRRADDAVDLTPAGQHGPALERLTAELDTIYGDDDNRRDATADTPLLAAFADVIRRRRIPARYPRELLAGMGMDVGNQTYRTVDELSLYGYRVAGTVGLMMCHVMGLRDPIALAHAAHLGMAMQLTNICRDVAEDHQRGRCYLPRCLLLAGADDPAEVARAVATLLAEAGRLYRSSDAGFSALPLRCALAARTARHVYAAIGTEIARRGFDVLSGRAVVPGWRKLLLVGRALWQTLRVPTPWMRRRTGECLTLPTLRFPHDVIAR